MMIRDDGLKMQELGRLQINTVIKRWDNWVVMCRGLCFDSDMALIYTIFSERTLSHVTLTWSRGLGGMALATVASHSHTTKIPY
jgi:hypothetical protein